MKNKIKKIITLSYYFILLLFNFVGTISWIKIYQQPNSLFNQKWLTLTLILLICCGISTIYFLYKFIKTINTLKNEK